MEIRGQPPALQDEATVGEHARWQLWFRLDLSVITGILLCVFSLQSSCGNVIQQLERDIEQERKVITSSRQLTVSENSCCSLTSKHTTN